MNEALEQEAGVHIEIGSIICLAFWLVLVGGGGEGVGRGVFRVFGVFGLDFILFFLWAAGLGATV